MGAGWFTHAARFTTLLILLSVAFGKAHFLVVLSGSMEPVLMTGDLAIVAPRSADAVEVGDLLTYRDPMGRTKVLITHRVIGVEEGEGGRSFQTKGDNLEEVDPYRVGDGEVFGHVVFVVPKAGAWLQWAAQNKMAVLALLVALPGGALLWSRRSHGADAHGGGVVSRAYEARVRWDRLGAALLFGLAAAAFLFGPFLLASGTVEGGQVANGGLVSGHFVLTSESLDYPRYLTLEPGDAQAVGVAGASSAAAPALLPLFWCLQLARLGAYAPSLTGALALVAACMWASRPMWVQRVRVRTVFTVVHRQAPDARTM